MHKIDSVGAVVSKPAERAVGDVVGFFSPGDPSLGQPSTIVTYEWLNAVQGELTAVIAAAGIALDKTSNAQLLAALAILINNTLEAAAFVVPNNATTAITGLLFDSAVYRSAEVKFDLRRKTDSFNGMYSGVLKAAYIAGAWVILGPNGDESGDDHGCTFSINSSTGQISIVANNMTGTNYAATIAYKVSRFAL